MPSATYIPNEFYLTDTEGHPTCLLADVALDIEYGQHDGLWRIVGVGFVIDDTNPYFTRCAWIQETTALEQMIIARAMAKYRADIDEHVANERSRNAATVPFVRRFA